MEFLLPHEHSLSQTRRSVEQKVLTLAKQQNVGLHGTSSYRDTLIDLTGKYDPPNEDPNHPDFGFTYYSLIDPERMKQFELHPLFFSYAINLAREFAHKAVREDGGKGIPSRPVFRVMTNMHPETVMDDMRTPEGSGPLLVALEARERHHGLYEKTIGKIDETDDGTFVYDADVIDHDTRFMQRLVPILLRPQSPVRG